jgi:hypothetical protein
MKLGLYWEHTNQIKYTQQFLVSTQGSNFIKTLQVVSGVKYMGGWRDMTFPVYIDFCAKNS